MDNRTVHQPIHPDVRPLLDPEYAAFHDQYYQHIVPDDQKVWDGSARLPLDCPPTGSTPVAVGSVEDLDLGNYTVRVFTPDSPKPSRGWPAFLWLHGGGWAVGGVEQSNDFLALICQRAKAVVVTVGYRLAPEHPFPAAFDDSVDALKWLCSDEATTKLGVDPSSVAIGGLSAGGQMAASLAIKAGTLQPPIKLKFQLLVVPVIDNTATTSTIWASRKNAPWLTPPRMTWYRKMYFTDEKSVETWEASPNFAPKALLATSPKTWIAVAEQDLLAPEAQAYAEQLDDAWKEAGVNQSAVVSIYQGSTHGILVMNGMRKHYSSPFLLLLGASFAFSPLGNNRIGTMKDMLTKCSGVLSKGRQLMEDAANQAAAWFSS
jgi:acetyl esterase/lipase